MSTAHCCLRVNASLTQPLFLTSVEMAIDVQLDIDDGSMSVLEYVSHFGVDILDGVNDPV